MCQQYWSCIILSYARIMQMVGKRACALFPICRFILCAKIAFFMITAKEKPLFTSQRLHKCIILRFSLREIRRFAL